MRMPVIIFERTIKIEYHTPYATTAIALAGAYALKLSGAGDFNAVMYMGSILGAMPTPDFMMNHYSEKVELYPETWVLGDDCGVTYL